MSKGMPHLNLADYPTQIFWLVVTFSVLFLLLSKVFIPKLAAIVKKRRDAVQGDLATAKRLREDLIRQQLLYDEKLYSAHKQASDIVDNAYKIAKENAIASESKLNKELSILIENAQDELQKTSVELRQDMKQIIDDVVAQISVKLHLKQLA